MIVVIYARLSKDEDKKSYTSIVAQIDICTKYAKEQGWEIYKIYEDDDVSGYTFDRPGFNQLVKDIDENNVDIILAKDLSRVGRHNAQTLLFLDDLKKKEKRIILVEDNYDSEKDDDDIIGIKTWYNERYVKDASKKQRANARSRQSKGEYITLPPFGYKKNPKNKHKLIIDEETAPYVQKVFRLYIDEGNLGYRKIANILTKENIPTPSMINQKKAEEEGKVYKKGVTKEWTSKMVCEIINKDVYIGTLRTHKTEIKGINGTVKQINKENQFVFENSHEAIISKNDFELAQQIAQRRKKYNYRGEIINKNLFSGFLFCEDCGSNMVALNKNNGNNQCKAYICGRYHQMARASGCTTHYINEDKLVIAFKKQLEIIRKCYKDFINAFNEEITSKKIDNKNYDKLLLNHQKQLKILNNELKILIKTKISDLMKNPPEYKQMIEDNYNELENEKKIEILRLNEKMNNIIKLKEQINSFEEKSNSILNIFDNIINRGKKDITKKDLEPLIEKITINNSRDIDIQIKGNLQSMLLPSMEVKSQYCTFEKIINITTWILNQYEKVS